MQTDGANVLSQDAASTLYKVVPFLHHFDMCGPIALYNQGLLAKAHKCKLLWFE